MAMDVPMIEILSRLPLKPLARCKCVSKYWYHLIASLHCQNDVLLKREVKDEESGEIETRFSFFTAGEEAEVESPAAVQAFQSPLVHGYSHGMLCFSDQNSDIFLCNSATGELRKLPYSRLLHDISHRGLESNTLGFGFGYDPESRCFKVVRIVDSYAHTQDYSTPCRAELYNSGKDEDGWREIQAPIHIFCKGSPYFDRNYQGFYYWWASHILHGSELILSFDFTNDVFGLIPMPQDFYLGDKSLKSLAVFNGSLVLLRYPCVGIERSFDVWIWNVVKEDDDDGREGVSWTKLFTFGPLSGLLDPLAFVSSNQLLMVENDEQLTLCDIFNPQHCNPLPIKGEPDSFQAYLFDKTTLSLKGRHRLS